MSLQTPIIPAHLLSSLRLLENIYTTLKRANQESRFLTPAEKTMLSITVKSIENEPANALTKNVGMHWIWAKDGSDIDMDYFGDEGLVKLLEIYVYHKEDVKAWVSTSKLLAEKRIEQTRIAVEWFTPHCTTTEQLEEQINKLRGKLVQLNALVAGSRVRLKAEWEKYPA